jgi:four helix bundle protein
MRDYRKLSVWENSHRLTLEVYRLTAGLPRSERFGLSSQLRRAASSIACNIAEGAGRRTRPDYARFLDVALGSANELEYLLILAGDLDLLRVEDAKEVLDQVDHIRRQLLRLHAAVITDGPENPPSP